jgi:hypothetical protein
VWTGVRSTAWTRVASALDLAEPELVWTGDAFVLIGVRDLAFVNYVSSDGLSWTEVTSAALGGPDGCGRPWLAGEPGAVMFGVPGCAVWKGVLQ